MDYSATRCLEQIGKAFAISISSTLLSKAENAVKIKAGAGRLVASLVEAANNTLEIFGSPQRLVNRDREEEQILLSKLFGGNEITSFSMYRMCLS